MFQFAFWTHYETKLLHLRTVTVIIFFYPTNLVARARFMIYVILTRTVCPPVQAHRRRKILNIGAGGVQGSENFGGRRG